MNERGGWTEGCVMMESGSGAVRIWSVFIPSVYPVSTYLYAQVYIILWYCQGYLCSSQRSILIA